MPSQWMTRPHRRCVSWWWLAAAVFLASCKPLSSSYTASNRSVAQTDAGMRKTACALQAAGFQPSDAAVMACIARRVGESATQPGGRVGRWGVNHGRYMTRQRVCEPCPGAQAGCLEDLNQDAACAYRVWKFHGGVPGGAVKRGDQHNDQGFHAWPEYIEYCSRLDAGGERFLNVEAITCDGNYRPARGEVLLKISSGETSSNGPAPAPCAETQAAGLYGVNIDILNPLGRPSVNELKALGARWVRVEFKAEGREGMILAARLKAYEDALAAYRAANLKILLILDYALTAGRPDMSGFDGRYPAQASLIAAWEEYFTRFSGRLQRVVDKLGPHVDAWELWNEPDLQPGGGYVPTMPRESFGTFMRIMAAQLKKSSQAAVVAGGLASGAPSWLKDAIAAAGGPEALKDVDAFSIHPYGQRPEQGFPRLDWGHGDLSALVGRYRQVSAKPIWISEIGIKPDEGDDETRADYLKKFYKFAEKNGIPRVFWFAWSDGMVEGHGLMTRDGKTKPEFDAFKQIANASTMKCTGTPSPEG